MTDDEAFIRAIVAAPGDDAPRLVYADWLDERGDPRGAYLRAEANWAHSRMIPDAVGLSSTSGLDPVWAARISRPPVGACCDRFRFVDCGPQLGVADLLDAETRLGVQFPPAYRAFLLNYNAGQLKPSEGTSLDPCFMDDDSILHFYPLKRPTTNACLVNIGSPAARSGLLPLGYVTVDGFDVAALYLGLRGASAGRLHFCDLARFEWLNADGSPNPDGLSDQGLTLPEYLGCLTQ